MLLSMGNKTVDRDLDSLFQDAMEFAAEENEFEVEKCSQRIPHQKEKFSSTRKWYEAESGDGRTSQISYSVAEGELTAQVRLDPTENSLKGSYDTDLGDEVLEEATGIMERYEVAEIEELESEYTAKAVKVKRENR